jgi:predicted neutral ceramidase superfamily lipid hydrolase
MAFGFVRLAFAYFGIPEPLNGKVPLAGLVINALAAVFVLMPYRRIARLRRGNWVVIAFLLFACGYSLFAATEIIRSLQGRLPFTVIVFHVFLLTVVWSNFALLYVWLEAARHPRSA